MKQILIVCLICFILQPSFSQTKTNDLSFPTNLSETNFDDISIFIKKVVAFDAVIENIENNRDNTPIYKLKIAENKYLWTALMFRNETNFIGDTIRVVGYLRKSKPRKSAKQFIDTEFVVLCFGLMDIASQKLLFINGAESQREEWISGKIPSSY